MNIKKPLLIIILLSCIISLYARDSIKDILKNYNSSTLNKDSAVEIMEAIEDAGFKNGPALDDLIRAEGFDPEELKLLSRPTRSGGSGKGAEPGKPGDPKNNPPNKNKSSGKIYSSLTTDYGTSDFKIHSIAIKNRELLEKYKCEEKVDGIEKSIPLNWDNIPKGTKSLAIVMYHYPNKEDKTGVNSYLLLWGIDPTTKKISYGEASSGNRFMGQNKDGRVISYTSPCSPSAGSHEYVITIFALAKFPSPLPKKSSIDIDFDQFMTAIEANEILGKAEIIFNDVNI
ncbi:MAG: YbhB/YbcL family Raf kinase inhibitor-like protein [Spirochaetaceae bacterium]